MNDESKLAQEITSVLPAGSVARVCSEDRDTIRFSVNGNDLKLRMIVLSRASLRKLHSDPAASVKIEYLQRDLIRSAMRRAEFHYPRISRILRKGTRAGRLRAASLAVAALAR